MTVLSCGTVFAGGTDFARSHVVNRGTVLRGVTP